MIAHFNVREVTSKRDLEQLKNIIERIDLQRKSEDVKVHPRKANNIEFDWDSWSWHGIEDDIRTAWNKRFGEDLVCLTLVNLREWLKKRPEYERDVIYRYYSGNWAFFIWDALERAENWRKNDDIITEETNRRVQRGESNK